MKSVKRISTYAMIAVIVLLITFMYIVPLQRQTGTIDTTVGICVEFPKAVKRYHLLFGQKHDYELVTPHLINDTRIACGQDGDFRLYL